MTTRDEDMALGEQVARVLDREVRRNPLPADFGESIAASLEDRAARRLTWFSGAPAVVATLILAVIAVALPLSLTRPSTTPGPGTTDAADSTAAASALPSSTTPHASPTADASQRPLTEAEAVEIAVRADGRPGMSSLSVQFGPARQVLPRVGFEWADVPSDDTWVWLISVWDGGPSLGAEGSFVVIDYFDGTIYGVQNWRS